MATAAARDHEEARPHRRLTRRTRRRDWVDYGPPPVMPLWSEDLTQKVDDALLQRRMSPTQHSVAQYMQKLAGNRGWCVFSTKHWMEKLCLSRTQLLRARRELVEQHIAYYREFPLEPEPPFIDQPDCGWIGFYPPAEWHPRTKATWGGARDHTGRKSQAICNNLNSGQSEQEDCNSLIFWPSEAAQVDTDSLVEATQTDTDRSLQGGSQTAAKAAALSRSRTNKITPISNDIGTANAAPGAVKKQDITIERSTASPLPGCLDQTNKQHPYHANDKETPPPTAEFQEPSEQNLTGGEIVSAEQLAAWRAELEEAKEEERKYWRAFEDAQARLDAAGHGITSGRDRLVLRRLEASQDYHLARDRRQAYALIIRLAEAGISKQEAIARALEQYPHLRRQEEEELPKDTPETPPEPMMLSGETLRRALFSKLCEMFLPNPKDEIMIKGSRPYFNGCINGKKLPGMLLEMLIQPEELEYLRAAFKWLYPQTPVTASAISSGKNLPLLIGTAQGLGYSFARDRLSGQTHPGTLEETPAEEANLEAAEMPFTAEDDEGEQAVEGRADEYAWVEQLCCFVPDVERAPGDRQQRSVRMLWGFVRDELRSGLNTARRQHLDALIPAWNPAHPRELVLLSSMGYTIDFINRTLVHDIDHVIEKLLRQFFDCARPVFAPQEVLDEMLHRWEQEAAL